MDPLPLQPYRTTPRHSHSPGAADQQTSSRSSHPSSHAGKRTLHALNTQQTFQRTFKKQLLPMEVSFQWNKEESVHLEFGNLKYASIRMQQFDKWKK